jgi:hypothetical protein
MKEKQICWTGSQGEYDDPVSLSQFLILVMFHVGGPPENPLAKLVPLPKSRTKRKPPEAVRERFTSLIILMHRCRTTFNQGSKDEFKRIQIK